MLQRKIKKMKNFNMEDIITTTTTTTITTIIIIIILGAISIMFSKIIMDFITSNIMRMITTTMRTTLTWITVTLGIKQNGLHDRKDKSNTSNVVTGISSKISEISSGSSYRFILNSLRKH